LATVLFCCLKYLLIKIALVFFKYKLKNALHLDQILFLFFGWWQIFALWHKRKRNYFNVNFKKIAIFLEKITKFSKPQNWKNKLN